ncbi:MAG: dihydropteroate synthase [Nannocystaceae bacterium]|nr:dihydropteroate synthase [Nannocystaceae bacterium]
MSVQADAMGFAAAPWGDEWLHATGALSLSRPRVMGIVNLTPDSFYDGGVLVAEGTDAPNVSVAVRRARQLVADGADVIDIGGESTRPGSDPVSDARQLRRVIPVIERLASGADAVTVPVSIDTRSAVVAARALDAGASISHELGEFCVDLLTHLLLVFAVGLLDRFLGGCGQRAHYLLVSLPFKGFEGFSDP